ncbi:MAG: YggS family pyridoxal phosphate-dependent enzyme [Dehalococcoidia bacterium]|nr:MAG: YggS family pyridoxal phosphate-dependent enzyme [Dehalococcoidia bacterium]
MYSYIRINVCRLLSEIPPHVSVVAVAKTRTPEEIAAALDAGIHIIGQNYIQEAISSRTKLNENTSCHFIGHLQSNKVKKAVELFDLIETVDNLKLATALDHQARLHGKVMPVLIEVNIGREAQKSGVLPDELPGIALSIEQFPNLKLHGLMTMGPHLTAEKLRPYFAETRRLFDNLQQLNLPDTNIRYLSMGMSDSYLIAIEEGANLVRLGTAIFGQRC